MAKIPTQVVTLSFFLDEEVTPELFVSKVAIACARGNAIREGEAVGFGSVRYKRTPNIDIPAGVVGKDEIKDVPNVVKEVWDNVEFSPNWVEDNE